jgi:hypothetical protein
MELDAIANRLRDHNLALRADPSSHTR